jgi:lipopolysaccharide biosynthesis regulator YciM
MNATIVGTGMPRGGGSRRLVGLERHYRCQACGGESHSWKRLRHCPGCGSALGAARIRRAALA